MPVGDCLLLTYRYNLDILCIQKQNRQKENNLLMKMPQNQIEEGRRELFERNIMTMSISHIKID